MKIIVSQIYIEPGVYYPFEQRFQNRLSDYLNALVKPSDQFLTQYGDDYNLIFRMSAKAMIHSPELMGPTVFKRDKSVEYTVFLTFSSEKRFSSDHLSDVICELLECICKVLRGLGFGVAALQERSSEIASELASDPRMVES